jgi:hypothetical protein
MLTNLVRVKILTDALASVASVWKRAWWAFREKSKDKLKLPVGG